METVMYIDDMVGGYAALAGVKVVGPRLGKDDAVGAVSVHAICGTWGVIAVAIFDTTDGLIYGGTSLFVPQLIGVTAIGVWAYMTSLLSFKLIDSFIRC